MYDEYDFTLEDAMNAVDELIEERAARGAHKKLIASRVNKIDAIDDKIAKLKNVIKTAQNSGLKATLLDKISKLELERDALKNMSSLAGRDADGEYKYYGPHMLNAVFNDKHSKHNKNGRAHQKTYRAMKRALGVKPNTYTPRKPNEFLNAQKALHESVNDRVLDVCDAYEEGIINDEEFDMMLEMLDFDNYE